MKLSIVVLLMSVTTLSAQINLNKLKANSTLAQEVISGKKVSQDEVARGIKEALEIGAVKSSEKASKEGGFESNLKIRISTPKEAKMMKETLIKVGMKNEVIRFERSLNTAAEKASVSAKEILVEAVKNIKISDAKKIINGNNDAATRYLHKQTNAQLFEAFSPLVAEVVKSTGVKEQWDMLVGRYNAIAKFNTIDVDIERYVTNKTIDGLFVLIEKEEKEIRENPKARTSKLLKKVFK